MKKSKQSPKKLQHKTILHILTGSIAAYKTPELVQKMREEGARVICVVTRSAEFFVTPLVLRAISGEKVYRHDDFFSAETPYDVLHTTLAEQVDAVLVAPASADFIARAAHGMADDLAACILLATRKPIVIAPAMNDQMYTHRLTQQNLLRLKEIGYRVVDPISGHLVCGREAVGHISDPQTIIDSLSSILSRNA